MSTAKPAIPDQISRRAALLRTTQSYAGYGSVNTSDEEIFSPKCLSESDEQLPQLVPKSQGSAILCLLAQHASNCFIANAFHFGAYLFLAEIFTNTLAPASLVGLANTSCAMLVSGRVGDIVDNTSRLKFVRSAIATQKVRTGALPLAYAVQIVIIINYGLFSVLFGHLRQNAADAFHGQGEHHDILMVWGILLVTILFSTFIYISWVGVNVAIERDWVTAIAQGDPLLLTKLNAYMRMIDLVSKLLSPMLVCMLTPMYGYPTTVIILAILSTVTLFTELIWTQVVYNRFPILKTDEELRKKLRAEHVALNDELRPQSGMGLKWWEGVKAELAIWKEFTAIPAFWPTLGQSMTWLSTLAMDGMGLSFFKMTKGWDDGFLAIVRALCVIGAFSGTVIMPWLERRFGTGKNGFYSLIAGNLCYLVAAVAFFTQDKPTATWNSILMVGGMALGRIGHCSFDLSQVKLLQIALEYHPRRNRLTALQSSMQSLFGLLKFLIVFILPRPDQFKWTTLASYIADVGAILTFLVYFAKRGKKSGDVW